MATPVTPGEARALFEALRRWMQIEAGLRELQERGFTGLEPLLAKVRQRLRACQDALLTDRGDPDA